MRALRLLLAGLLVVTALVAGFFAAAVILVTGMLGYVVQLFMRLSGKARPRPVQASGRVSPLSKGDVIDVVATNVPTEKVERS